MQTFSNERFEEIPDELNSGFEYAGFWVRLAAYVIDMTIVTVGLLIVRLVFLGINSLIADTFLGGNILFHYTLKDIVLYGFQVVYFIMFTYYTGSTLGKRALNLKVIHADSAEEISLITVIYRETIGRFLCGVILCIGYLLVGIDKEKRGLHDILCNTRVIYAKKVKVYPVYQGRSASHKSDICEEVIPINPKEDATDYVSHMVDDSSIVGNCNNMQKDIQAQWNRILNPQKEETMPQNEEQNIEGNP